MRYRRFQAFDYIIMVTVIGIIISVIFITSTGSVEPVKGVKRLTPSEKRVKRSTDLLALTSTMTSESDVCQLPGLNDILVPRVAGTKENEKVRDYLVGRLKKLGWHVELDTFTQKALQPVSDDLKDWKMEDVTFSNIIGYSNKDAPKQVVITAHFDSKLYAKRKDGKEFLAAVDSAVPVAMILSMIDNLHELLSQRKESDKGIVVVFFDGEEAFKDWTKTDSVYGSRHLADKWKEEGFYSKMELFLLLDLLGGPNPHFASSFKETEWVFDQFFKIERELASSGLMSYTDKQYYFRKASGHWGIEDDHKPFENNGYRNIVHIIPVPFPPQWHDITDDAEHLDCDGIHNLQKVLQLWIAQYFQLHKIINM